MTKETDTKPTNVTRSLLVRYIIAFDYVLMLNHTLRRARVTYSTLFWTKVFGVLLFDTKTKTFET